MTPQRHTFTTTRTAHYATLGSVGPEIRQLWIVCHGYAQLSHKFIQDFASIVDEETLVVAPEGLSRFYWGGGFHGPVVASWMTSGDRLAEIADYSNYLSQIYQHFVGQIHPEASINLLGFSQGCATQVRWLMRTFPRFDRLILWAGQLPEDLDYGPQMSYWQDKDLHFVYGTEDPLLSPERMSFVKTVIQDSGLSFQEHSFAGKHEIDGTFLQSLVHSITT